MDPFSLYAAIAPPSSGRGSGLSLHVLNPPYQEFEPLYTAQGLPPKQPPFGALVGLQASCALMQRDLLSELVPRIRAWFASTPVVLLLAGNLSEESIRLGWYAGVLRFRAVLMEGEPVSTTLRRSLTYPEDLPGDVLEWLLLQGIDLSPELCRLVGQIFAHAPTCTEISDLLRLAREPETSARARCRKKRLPPPHCWLQVARALHAALHLQRSPDVPVAEIAFQLGYNEPSALGQLLRRSFGLNSTAVRQIIGWEPLLHRWLTAHHAKGLFASGRNRQFLSNRKLPLWATAVYRRPGSRIGIAT